MPATQRDTEQVADFSKFKERAMAKKTDDPEKV